MEEALLVELLTEELPPKSLRTLGDAFADQLVVEIVRHRLKDRDPEKHTFATPRRLAVLIPEVRKTAPESSHSIDGPVSSNIKAVEGFARKHKVAREALERVQTAKGEIVVAKFTLPGVHLDSVLANIVEAVLTKLPISRMMRWGDGDARFVRPVHGLVMLHGTRVVPGKVLGLESTNRTRGHRFMGRTEIALASADDYEKTLRDEGMVIADFDERRAEIENQLQAESKRQTAVLHYRRDFLDEVTALVEHPSVHVGRFEEGYLGVPQECLILTMRQNQKYFPLFDSGVKLLPKFLIVSNMRVEDPSQIIQGNERVIRPRLDDARFFYDQDRKTRLEERVPQLAKVVYHNKLGSLLERVERIQLLAGKIARDIGADPLLVERAAWLAKADLLTRMVGEFPELQGVMGRYYALHDGESTEVANAIEAHYHPRFAGDVLPEGHIACALALADKLDALAGLFGIGQQPSGDRDPFGLRRAALGLIRILVERSYPLGLNKLVEAAFAGYPSSTAQAHVDLEAFIRDRFAGYLKDRGYSTLEVDAVLSLNLTRLDRVPDQLQAVREFLALPEAASLAAANKRVANILRQASAKGESFAKADGARLLDPAERELFDALGKASRTARPLFDQGDFTGYLKTFAILKGPVDAFFDSVMVMAENADVRRNRLALLADLRMEMNRVADISKLAT